MKDKVPYIFWGLVLFVLALLFLPELWASDVYMQLYKDREATAPVRTLHRDARMPLEECLEHKARVEKPLSAGGNYSIPSGYTVECVPVEYLDGEPRL